MNSSSSSSTPLSSSSSSSSSSTSPYPSNLSNYISLIQKSQRNDISSQERLQIHQVLQRNFTSLGGQGLQQQQQQQSQHLPFLIQVLKDPSISFPIQFFSCHLLKEAVSKARISISDSVMNVLLELYLQQPAGEGNAEGIHASQYPLVRNQIAHILSIIAKKNIHFLPNSQQQQQQQTQFMMQLKSMIDYLMQKDGVLGLKFILALCSEFSSHKVAHIALSYSEHETSRVLFQDILLEHIYLLVLNVIQNQVQSPNVLLQAFAILNKILNWDFAASHSIFRKRSVRFQNREEETFVPEFLHPKTENWKNHLLDVRLVQLLVNVHAQYRNTQERLSHSIRQCLVRLAQITVFAFKDRTPSDSIQYFSSLLQTHLNLCSSSLDRNQSSDASQVDTREILDGSEGLKFLFSFVHLQIFASIPTIQQILDQFTSVTCRTIQLTKNTPDSESQEALDMLLTSWLTFVCKFQVYFECGLEKSIDTGIDEKTIASNIKAMNQLLLTTHAPKIVQIFVNTSISSKRNQQQRDILQEDYDTVDRLQAFACVARMTLHYSLSLLKNHLEEHLQKYRSFVQSSLNSSGAPQNPGEFQSVLNGLIWLLRVTLFIIADTTDAGESAFIPSIIMEYTSKQPREEGMVLIQVNQLVFQVAELENQCIEHKNQNLIHAPLSTMLLQYFNRFAPTYLLPDPSLYTNISPLLIEFYGHNENGKKLARFFLDKILINLYRMLPANEDVATETCNFFSSLVELSHVQEYLVSTDTWKQLLLQDRQTFTSLSLHSNTIKSKITEILCKSCGVLKRRGASSDDLVNYLSQVLMPLKDQLFSVLQSPDFSQNFSNDNVRRQIEYCMSKCVGVSRACQLDTWRPMFQFLTEFQFFQAMRNLMGIYSEYADLEVWIFEFFAVLLKEVHALLSNDQMRFVFGEFLSGMSVFVEKCKKNLESNSEEENNYKRCLVFIMQTLTYLLSSDLFSTEADSGGDRQPIGVLLFQGLSQLLPLITKSMLDFSELRHEYFIMVNSMIEVYPSHVCELPPAVFGTIIQSLEFGIGHFESEIVSSSLGTLSALVTHHVTSGKGDVGFQKQLQAHPDFTTKLLRRVVHLMLYESLHQSVVNDLSRALLALICLDENKYRTVVEEFIRDNQDRENLLREAFGQLQQGITPNLSDYKNQTQFCKNMKEFLIHAKIGSE